MRVEVFAIHDESVLADYMCCHQDQWKGFSTETYCCYMFHTCIHGCTFRCEPRRYTKSTCMSDWSTSMFVVANLSPRCHLARGHTLELLLECVLLVPRGARNRKSKDSCSYLCGQRFMHYQSECPGARGLQCFRVEGVPN